MFLETPHFSVGVVHKHETVIDTLNDLKAYLQYGRYFKVEKDKDGKI